MLIMGRHVEEHRTGNCDRSISFGDHHQPMLVNSCSIFFHVDVYHIAATHQGDGGKVHSSMARIVSKRRSERLPVHEVIAERICVHYDSPLKRRLAN